MTKNSANSQFGSLDAEAIIAYDLGREHPASEEIHACLRQIADKPHRAPLYLADLLALAKDALADLPKTESNSP